MASSFNRFEFAEFAAYGLQSTTADLVLVAAQAGRAFVLTAFDAVFLSGTGALAAELQINFGATSNRIWFTQPAGGTEELLKGLNGVRVIPVGRALHFVNLGGTYDVVAHGFWVPQT